MPSTMDRAVHRYGLLLFLALLAPTITSDRLEARQNLLVNGDFDTSLEGWESNSINMQLAWDPEDSLGALGSGSVRATNTFERDSYTSVIALDQCVPVTPGETYYRQASAFVPAGQPAVRAQFQVRWLAGSCEGGSLSISTLEVQTEESWVVVASELTAPASATQAEFVLRVVKEDEEPGTVLADRLFFGPANGPRPSSCTPSPTGACIADRFLVTVDFDTERNGGLSGSAQALSLDSLGVDRGALFTFFGADNPELLIKVLDACALNGHYWVYYSAGTDVGFDISVVDTETDQTWERSNPDGRAAPPVQDTQAIPCAP